MKIVVGLGNPGDEYERTRHNIGFMVLDCLARQENLAFSKKKFKDIRLSHSEPAETLWIMGQLEPLALGNIKLEKLRTVIEGGKK